MASDRCASRFSEQIMSHDGLACILKITSPPGGRTTAYGEKLHLLMRNSNVSSLGKGKEIGYESGKLNCEIANTENP